MRGVTATKIIMRTFAETIAGSTGRRIIDKTGLEGDFDFNFTWSDQDADGPSIFTALQEA